MSGFRIVGLVAIALVLSGCDYLIDPSPDIIYLVPEHFSGWMCVDFDVKSAPPLPREGKALVVRPRGSDIIETSDPHDTVWYGEVWIEVGSERRALPEDVRSGLTMSATGPNEPFQRVCRFVGTIDQQDAAGNPPGLDEGWFATRPVPASERAALIAFFESTGGPEWTHKVGWLGPPGTECNWHGVDCASKYDEPTTNVTGLDLYDTTLRGFVPEAFGDLPYLKRLHLNTDDKLAGKLPPPLLRRWLSGDLEVLTGPGSLFTDVTAIEIDSSEFSWCGRGRIILRPDGSASSVAQRCGQLLPPTWNPHCELKEGWFYYQDFARLANTIEQSSYFSLKPEYQRDVTHAALEITRVTRNGRTHQVSDYASAGPQELWTIRQAIQGVSNGVRWTDRKTQQACPAQSSTAK
jgi:hypothetical protein